MALTKAWQRNLLELFETGLPQRVFTRKQIATIQGTYGEQLELPQSLSTARLITFLEDAGQLREERIAQDTSNPSENEAIYRPYTRYVWGDASPMEVALSLRTRSYLSHASAVFLHGLTTQLPKTVYVNQEQTPKPPPSGELTQQSIDRAFRSAPRLTNYIFSYRGTRLVLLNGKNSRDLEVSDMVDASGHVLRTTKLERTLIDITVRPTYAGGIFEVLEAFRGARDRISIPTLVATLAKLDFVYPYHQALGFYLARIGIPSARLKRLAELGIEHDFYLGYKIPNPQFDTEWRIYYPEGLWDGVRA